MRILSKKKISLDIRMILAFALPVLIMALAFLFAQTEPGSILPVEATLRRGKADPDILMTVNTGLKDHDSILEAMDSDSAMMRNEGLKRIITEYCDPFFIFSLCLTGDACKIFLFAVFFIKFGLAGLAMQRLLSRRIGSGPFFEVLLSVIYPLSSVALLSSASMVLMDLVILLPLMLKAYDELIMPGSRTVSIKCIGICALVFMTGIHGLIQGLFASFVFAFFIAVTRYGRFAGVMRSLARISVNSLAGLLITSFINIPRFADIRYEKLSLKLFEEGEMGFALFDMFSSNASGIAVDSSAFAVPAMYIGIITFMLIMILYLNRSIPIRIKMIIMIITVFVYACSSYDPIVKILSFTFYSTAASIPRLASLTVILFVAAAISAKNLSSTVRNTVYASAFISISIVIIANASENVYGYMNYQLFMTVLSAVVSACFLVSYVRCRDKRIMAAFGAVAVIALFLNTSYAVMMSVFTPSDYVTCRYDDGSDGCTVESDVFLSVLSERSGFVIVSESGMTTGDNDDPAAMVNNIASGMMLDEVFTKIDVEEVLNENFDVDADGVYTINNVDEPELILGPDTDEDVYVSSGVNGPLRVSALRFQAGRYPDSMDYSGPFVYRAGYEGMPFEVSLKSDGEQVYTGRIGVYILEDHELDRMMIMTGDTGTGLFALTEEQIPAAGGGKSLITGIGYDDNILVEIDGRKCETYNCYGLLAAHIGDVTAGTQIEIIKGINGAGLGAALTVTGILMTAGMVFITRKNRIGGIVYA